MATLTHVCDRLRITARRPREAAVLRSAAAVGLCGFAASLPFLNERMFPATWVGMTLWIALTESFPARAAFRWWFWGGFAFLLGPMYWLPGVVSDHFDLSLITGAGLALLAVGCEALRFGVFGWLAGKLSSRLPGKIWLWPTLWVALEWAWPQVFPWRLGQTQIGWLAVCQIAEATGVYGVSFLVMWGAAVAAHWLRARYGVSPGEAKASARRLGIFMLALMAVAFWGAWRMFDVDDAAAGQPMLRCALVQPGTADQDAPAILRELSLRPGARADLIIWGEGRLGTYSTALRSFHSSDEIARHSRYVNQDLPACRGLGRPLLCGGLSFSPPDRSGLMHNTAFLIGADQQVLGHYHKRRLMPWGEYTVGREWIPGLDLIQGNRAQMIAGDSAAPLRLPERARLGTLICYEDLSAEPARESVREGADVLVNLSNLAVFGRTAAISQHQRLAAFRAIENRRWFVRCGTTAGTAIISASGRIENQSPAHRPAVLSATTPRMNLLTIYTRYGDFFALLCVLASLTALAVRVVGDAKRARS
jgi:apolipoprotein N-acyltransferase